MNFHQLEASNARMAFWSCLTIFFFFFVFLKHSHCRLVVYNYNGSKLVTINGLRGSYIVGQASNPNEINHQWLLYFLFSIISQRQQKQKQQFFIPCQWTLKFVPTLTQPELVSHNQPMSFSPGQIVAS